MSFDKGTFDQPYGKIVSTVSVAPEKFNESCGACGASMGYVRHLKGRGKGDVRVDRLPDGSFFSGKEASFKEMRAIASGETRSIETTCGLMAAFFNGQIVSKIGLVDFAMKAHLSDKTCPALGKVLGAIRQTDSLIDGDELVPGDVIPGDSLRVAGEIKNMVQMSFNHFEFTCFPCGECDSKGSELDPIRDSASVSCGVLRRMFNDGLMQSMTVAAGLEERQQPRGLLCRPVVANNTAGMNMREQAVLELEQRERE